MRDNYWDGVDKYSGGQQVQLLGLGKPKET